MKPLHALILLMLAGCTSTELLESGYAKVDQLWASEYPGTTAERTRFIAAPPGQARAAIRSALLDLKIAIDPQAPAELLTAAAPASHLITIEEWAKVVKAEEPRIREVGGKKTRILSNPVRYYAKLKIATTPEDTGTRTSIGMDLDGPVYRQATSTHVPPPLAVQYASERLWQVLTKRLAEQGIPAPR